MGKFTIQCCYLKMGRKRCKAGKSCGLTCIQSKKICRVDLSATLSTSLGRTSAFYNSPAPQSGSIQPLAKPEGEAMMASAPVGPSGSIQLNLKTRKNEDFVRIGNEAIDKHPQVRESLKVFDEIRKAKEDIKREKGELGKFSIVERLKLKKRYFGLLAREIKEEFKLMKAMDNLRTDMLVPKVSQDVLNKLVSRVDVFNMGSAGTAKARETLMEFARMFNGRGLGDEPSSGTETGKRLRRVSSVEGGDRSYAMPSIGGVFLSKDATNRSMFHEFGHILESQNPNFVKFSEQWRNGKALTSEEIRKAYPGIPIVNVEASPGVTLPAVRLMNLHPESYDDPREVVLVDKYMNTYLGKVYPGGGTEVASVAIESFSDISGMSSLAKSHPDLFTYVVGLAMAD